MSLLSRLEALENSTPGIDHPDHIVTYFVDHEDGDEADDAKRSDALAAFKATHVTMPDDEFWFICVRFIDPNLPLPPESPQSWH